MFGGWLPGRQKNFPRIHQVKRVERAFDGAHHFQVELGFETFEARDVHFADAMFGTDAAAQLHAGFVDDQVDACCGFFAVFRRGVVVAGQHGNDVDVAITDMARVA